MENINQEFNKSSQDFNQTVQDFNKSSQDFKSSQELMQANNELNQTAQEFKETTEQVKETDKEFRQTSSKISIYDKYSTIPLMAVIFLFIVISVGLLIYIIYTLRNLPETVNVPIIDPEDIPCNESDVLNAYIYDYPNKPNCPPWTNNYIVSNSFNLYEKEFIQENSCCFYENDLNTSTIIDLPWVCVGNTNGYEYSVTELNQKPYISNGTTISYIVPPCTQGIHSEGCISLIYATRSIYKILSIDSGETYKNGALTTVPKQSHNNIEVGINTDLETTNLEITGLDFHLNPHCASLSAIYYYGVLIGEDEGSGFEFIPGAEIPNLARVVYDAFMKHHFVPIAGANPPATINAIENVYS